jgi:hypothetical protein
MNEYACRSRGQLQPHHTLCCYSNRDGNGSDSGRINQKIDLQKNILRLNLTPESEPVDEIWHLNPSDFRSSSGARRVL